MSLEFVGLRRLIVIVLQIVVSESLDLAQREALLEYVRGGGTILLPAPAAGRAGSWFEPMLPVHIVGSRLATQIQISPGGDVLKLREPIEIVEAVEGSGKALLRERDYVHAAVQSVGLGKIIFTSFP